MQSPHYLHTNKYIWFKYIVIVAEWISMLFSSIRTNNAKLCIVGMQSLCFSKHLRFLQAFLRIVHVYFSVLYIIINYSILSLTSKLKSLLNLNILQHFLSSICLIYKTIYIFLLTLHIMLHFKVLSIYRGSVLAYLYNVHVPILTHQAQRS